MGSEDSVFSRRFEYGERTKLTDSAYEEVKAAIVDLRFRPGDMLRESTIARQLGVSKTPVREALLKLKEDGLVELVPYKGAMVIGYDIDDVREIFELRAMLESECVRYVAMEGDESLIEVLAANVDATESAVAEDDVDTIIRLFDEFDTALFSRLENRRLQSLVENLQLHMERIGKLTTEIPGRVDTSLAQHASIVAVLVKGDSDEAQRKMREHIASVLADTIVHMKEHFAVEGPSASSSDRYATDPL